MPLFMLRYDLRAPSFGNASHAQLYRTALDQCAWADEQGFFSVTLSEHHGSPDGYLPSPRVLAAAVAARTRKLRILIAALIAPLHDPIALAEDLAVLDLLSDGRVTPLLSGGYVASEFEGFGKKLGDRKAYMDEIVDVLTRAWTGEPFEYRGRRVRVTPCPKRRPRPPVWMGGSSVAAARRAARCADYFIPSQPEYFEIFRQERLALGKPDPGPPPHQSDIFVYVADDPDATWEEIAPYLLHETNAYGRWVAEAGTASPYDIFDNTDDLRASGRYPIFTPDELIEKARGMGPLEPVLLHPLAGGMDPDLSWESLRLVETRVLPALRAAGAAVSR
jgi:alkanesulfonate monooxygenase SsuD/methylene tetrahydromethanopterin reductase-like flavin-dependent oxidoreductase (luciferase family)